jgi:phospholipase D1/2
MIIVDDKATLIGSANINDRSMLGVRDSEVAVLIEKFENKIPSKMNGKSYEACRFARSLRIRLMSEHLGLSLDEDNVPDILVDPLDDKLFILMKQSAKSNTLYYREIFNCYPDNNFLKFADILISKSQPPSTEELKEKYDLHKDKIVGNIVEFPLEFLKEENLNRSLFCKEILVPIKNFI